MDEISMFDDYVDDMTCEVTKNDVVFHQNDVTRSTPLQLDECWKLILGIRGVSVIPKFSVMMKSNGQNGYMLKLMDAAHHIDAVHLKWSVAGVATVELERNGHKTNIKPQPESRAPFRKDLGGYYGSVFISRDSKLVFIEAAEWGFRLVARPGNFRISYPGTYFFYHTNNLIGMCAPKRRSVLGSKERKTCIYSKPCLEAESYRIQTRTCPQLASSVKQELEKEKQQCQKLSIVGNEHFRE